MDKITQAVYDTLATRTEEIGKDIEEREVTDALISSGRYNAKYVESDLRPKRDNLRMKINYAADSAIQEAQNLINQYRKEAADRNRLDPAELTDDVKLLQPGIKLLPRDIEGMLERNSTNRTMTQIILRYAKENGIEMGGTWYIGGQQEEETAKALEGTLSYYRRWITTPDAKKMLDKFFGIIGQ